MSLGGLIPIGGGTGGGNGKKSSSNDLTGGLISIAGSRSATAAADVDVSDFDIDDLLSDGPPGGKKSKAASTKASNSSLLESPPSKDKKKNKDNKKKKEKEKKNKLSSKKSRDASEWSMGDDEDGGGGGGGSPSHDWDHDSADFSVPVKKSGVLDAEFAKMLGLEDDIGSVPLSFDVDKSPASVVEEDDSTFKYTPTVRRADKPLSQPINNDETKPKIEEKFGAIGGVSASFFHDDSGDTEPSVVSSSFATSDRRSGRRGGRTHGHDLDGEASENRELKSSTVPINDPFASKGGNDGIDLSAPSSIDTLFGPGKPKEVTNPFTKRDPKPLPSKFASDELLNELLGSQDDKHDEEKSVKSGSPPTGTTKTLSSSVKPNVSKMSAQDDLLSELLSGDDKRSLANRSSNLEKSAPDSEGFDRSRRRRGDSEQDISKMPKETTEKKVNDPVQLQEELTAKELNTDIIAKKEKRGNEVPSTPKPNDSQSARESLLMDLLGDLPSPTASKMKVATGQTDSTGESKDKPFSVPSEDKVARKHPSSSSTPRSPQDSSSPIRSPPLDKDKEPSAPLKPRLPEIVPTKEDPPPSPGRARTLTAPSASSVIKEIDFEQSKDSLLEELLTPTPSAPSSPIAADRGHYSQSFEEEESSTAVPLVPSPRRESRTSVQGEITVGMTSIPEHEIGTIPQDAAACNKNRDEVSGIPAAPIQLQASIPAIPSFFPVSVPSVSPSSVVSLPGAFTTETSGLLAHSKAEAHLLAQTPYQTQPQLQNQMQLQSQLQAQAQLCAQIQLQAQDKVQAAESAMLAASHREQELRTEIEKLQSAQATWKQHEGRLEEAKAALANQLAATAQQLSDEKLYNQEITMELGSIKSQHSSWSEEKRALMQQVSILQSDKLSVQRELTAIRAQHAECEKDKALGASHLESVQSQLTLADEKNRQLVRELGAEQRERQASQLKLQQRELREDREHSLERQRDKMQMDALLEQLQSTLAHLQLSHGASAVDEQRTRNQIEGAARMRMLSSLETSSKAYAQRTEDECHRLSGLLSTLGGLLRSFRQEHLEEKERLRQEQLRLDVLATHFQAQSTVLNERADANSQLLAKSLAASLQDARMADARVSTRRQQLEEHERVLFQERAEFAAYREQALADHAKEEQELAHQRQEIEVRWRELNEERADLDHVIAAHELDFQQLQRESIVLEDEKHRVSERAEQVAELAQRLEQFTSQLVSREGDAETRLEQLTVRERSLKHERDAIGERERRLNEQLRQLDRARGRLNEQRKRHFVSAATSSPASRTNQSVGDRQVVSSRRCPLAAAFNRTKNTSHAVTTASPTIVNSQAGPRGIDNQSEHFTPWKTTKEQEAKDPSGLPPALRELVEENWRRKEWQLGSNVVDARKERVWLSCVGLDALPSPSSTRENSVRDHATSSRSESQRLHPPLPPPARRTSQVCIDL